MYTPQLVTANIHMWANYQKKKKAFAQKINRFAFNTNEHNHGILYYFWKKTHIVTDFSDSKKKIYSSNWDKKGEVGFHLLAARLHGNLSFLASVCEVIVAGTDIVIRSCCPESQQSTLEGCRGIVQKLLQGIVIRLDWLRAATLSVTLVVARTSKCHGNVLWCWVRQIPRVPQGLSICEEIWPLPRQRIVWSGIWDLDHVMPVST